MIEFKKNIETESSTAPTDDDRSQSAILLIKTDVKNDKIRILGELYSRPSRIFFVCLCTYMVCMKVRASIED